MVADPLRVVRSYLLSVSALKALVNTRVYAGRDVPPEGYKIEDGPCITFRVRGGLADYEDALLRPSMQFKVYGSSEMQTERVYRALYTALHLATNADILHAECEGLGQNLEEPGTGWYFTLSFFRVVVRNS